MAWTFVRHLGREQDCYGRWWVRSVWQDGLGGEQCQELRFQASPSNEEVADGLTKIQGMLNAQPTPTVEEQIRAEFLTILDRHRAYIEAEPALAQELGIVFGGEGIPVPIEEEPIEEQPIPVEWGAEPIPIEEDPIEEEPIGGEELPLPGGGH